MDWCELSKNCKVRLEVSNNGFLDLQTKCSNENIAIEKILSELYFKHSGKSFITLEINRVLIFLDRIDHPHNSMFEIMGRKYRAGSDVFLNRTITLGKLETKHWDDYDTYISMMQPLLKCWIDLVKKDKEISPSYLW